MGVILNARRFVEEGGEYRIVVFFGWEGVACNLFNGHSVI